jgi:hypothetical protein
MFEKLYTKLLPVAKGRYIWPGLVLIVLFNAVFFPLPRKKLLQEDTLSGHLLDTRMFYSPNEAYALIESYGEEARMLYWKMALVVDNPYAVVYGLALVLILLFAFSRAFPDSRLLKKLAFLPVLAALFDVMENGSISYLIISFPEQHVSIVKLASFCTSMKWLLIGTSVLLLLISVSKSLLRTGHSQPN